MNGTMSRTNSGAGETPVAVIRVMVVDDHPVVREGISAIIATQPDLRIVAHAGTGAEALTQFATHRPAVTLMDLRLVGTSGIEVAERLRAEWPDARGVTFTR